MVAGVDAGVDAVAVAGSAFTPTPVLGPAPPAEGTSSCNIVSINVNFCDKGCIFASWVNSASAPAAKMLHSSRVRLMPFFPGNQGPS